MITNTANKVIYTGDGNTKQFLINFPFGDISEINLILHNISTGEDEAILSNWSYDSATGYITYPVSGSAMASTHQIVVIRQTPLTQEKDHTVRLFTSEDIETISDKLTREVQDISEKVDRSIKFPASISSGETDAKKYIDDLTDLKTQATTAASTATSQASIATSQATIATTKASEAATSAQNAATSESNAASSATAASNSAAAAAASEQHTIQNEQLLQEYVDQAEESANTAVSNATQAASSATSAAASAASASQDAASASTSATTASQAAVSASGSASAASVSASNAADSSSTATQKASEAASSATDAANSATAASSSETNAADSATAAAASATSIADSAAQIQQNKEDIAAIDAELEDTRDFVPPSDWVDIRSGALNNSIYVLVGHAADYSQYAKFSFIANTSTSGNTYDVYVDGIKQTTTASGTATTLDWQTLALDSGYDITYPAALRTHIVRITPTQSTDTLTRYRIYAISGQRDQGLLWLHFELSNPILIASLCATDTDVRNFLLQAVTAKNDNITYTVNSNSGRSGFYSAFRSCTSLKKIPVLTAQSTQYASGTYISFIDVPLKKVIIKNNSGREELKLINSAKTQEFDIENGVILSSASSGITDAHGAVNLKKLPPINASDAATFQAHGLTSLQDTFVDDSSNSSRKLFRFYGTGAEPVRGLKGLVVSNEAPFDGESPQINVAYTGLDRQALRQLFKSMPTVSANQVCNITGATGAVDLIAEDLAIATAKGWTVTR